MFSSLAAYTVLWKSNSVENEMKLCMKGEYSLALELEAWRVFLSYYVFEVISLYSYFLLL